MVVGAALTRTKITDGDQSVQSLTRERWESFAC